MSEVIDHIYGRKSISFSMPRPHMFIKELYAYINYLQSSIEDSRESITKKEQNRFIKFSENLLEGIEYYSALFNNKENAFRETKTTILSKLDASTEKLLKIHKEITLLSITTPV